MVTKSLPAFMHSSIGAKTHKPRAASKHMAYIMRPDAMTKFQAENMPDGGPGTRSFFDKLWQKAGMPENARIADQLIIALPLELTAEQRHELVESFMQALGKGRIAWCAAHHDKDKDAHNPHAHILFKDADIDSGRKVIGTTTSAKDVREAQENGWKVPPRMTTRDMRHAWCDHINSFMEREGIEVRFDARTLKERGIDRDPGIHVGPKANALAAKGEIFKSRDLDRNEQQGQQRIPYSQFDEGSRVAHNQRISEANRERALLDELQREPGKHGKDARALNKVGDDRREHDAFQLKMADERKRFATPENQEKHRLREAHTQARKALYAEQAKDREALRAAQHADRLHHAVWARKCYDDARKMAYKKVHAQNEPKWAAIRKIEDRKQRAKSAEAMKLQQKADFAQARERYVEAVRPMKDRAYRNMAAEHRQQTADLQAQHRDELAAISRQYMAERDAVHHKWRAEEQQKRAATVAKRHSAHPGIAAQQSAAVAMIKPHRRARQRDGVAAVPGNSREAMHDATTTGKQERYNLTLLRSALLRQRDGNQRRGAAAPVGVKLGGRPRRNAPGHAAAENGQAAVRQAVMSGQSLTPAERANAAPDIKQQLDKRDRLEAVRWVLSRQGSEQQQERGKGRPGGGRGR